MSQDEFRRVEFFTWKVEDYLAKVESLKPDEPICSPFFVDNPLGDSKDTRFQLKLFPKGEASSPNHIGLFLYNQSKETVKYEKISLFMLNERGQRANELSDKNGTIMAKTGDGWHEFCTSSWIETNRDKVLVAGSLTICCELKLLLPVVKVELGPSLGKDLYSALKRNVMTDLTLVCGEKRFPCHKFILASRSCVLNDMFENTVEDNSREVNIDELEPNIMEKLLKFIYINRVDASEHTKELFLAADRFNVLGLKRAAECEMMSSLSVNNVAEVLTLFDTHGCEMKGFEDKALEYALNNLPAVIKTDAWKLVESIPRLVSKTFQAMAAMQESKP